MAGSRAVSRDPAFWLRRRQRQVSSAYVALRLPPPSRAVHFSPDIESLARELALSATPRIEEMEIGHFYFRSQDLPEGVLASLSDEVQEGFRKSECLAFRTGNPLEPLRVLHIVGVNFERTLSARAHAVTGGATSLNSH